MKNLRIKTLSIIAIIAISSCSKDNEPQNQPDPVNEEELITTVNVVFTPVGIGNSVTLSWSDLDGDGLNPPIFAPIQNKFKVNTTYNGVVTILDQSKNPVDNITEEVIAESVDHQLFYIKTGNLPAFNYTPITEAPTNYDTNGKPLGLQTKFVTTGIANGSLKIVLKHEGNKSAIGVATGDFTNASGATDFDITFLGLEVIE